MHLLNVEIGHRNLQKFDFRCNIFLIILDLKKKFLEMGEKTPQQEIVELKARLRCLNAENETLKFIMEVIQEEYGEEVVKKYLPGLQLKKPPKKKSKSK